MYKNVLWVEPLFMALTKNASLILCQPNSYAGFTQIQLSHIDKTQI